MSDLGSGGANLPAVLEMPPPALSALIASLGAHGGDLGPSVGQNDQMIHGAGDNDVQKRPIEARQSDNIGKVRNPCGPDACCTDKDCPEMDVECCVDPTCRNADDRCDAPHGECDHVSPGSLNRPDVATVDADGHVQTDVVDVDMSSGAAGGESKGLNQLLEGDELVKWACSEEGCAAIQKYVSLTFVASLFNQYLALWFMGIWLIR